MIGPFGFHPNKTMRSRAFKLAQALVSAEHKVLIVMPPWQTPDEADRQWIEQGVELHYVSLSGGIVPTTHRLIQAALAWQPDVVHCFKPKAYSGLAAWWLWHTRRRRLPLVMDSDDWEGWGGWNDRSDYSAVQKHFFAWQEKDGMRHNHALTLASRELQKRAENMGISAEKIAYLPNGPGIDVDTRLPKSAVDAKRQALGLADVPVVVVYSRLFEFDTARLVTMLAAARRAVPTMKVLSIGTGLFAEEAQQLRAQFDSAEILDAVVDVGWVDEAELPLLLSVADVAVYLMDDTLLNRTKCPVKLADLAGMGLPVVGEAIGQVPEYVRNGETGLLRPSGDVSGLSKGLIQLLTDAELRAAFSAEARRHIQSTFAWPILAERLLSVYKSVLKP